MLTIVISLYTKHSLNQLTLRCWDVTTGEADLIAGNGHLTQVTNICASGDTLYTCSIDDTVRYVSISEKKYGYYSLYISVSISFNIFEFQRFLHNSKTIY